MGPPYSTATGGGRSSAGRPAKLIRYAAMGLLRRRQQIGEILEYRVSRQRNREGAALNTARSPGAAAGEYRERFDDEGKCNRSDHAVRPARSFRHRSLQHEPLVPPRRPMRMPFSPTAPRPGASSRSAGCKCLIRFTSDTAATSGSVGVGRDPAQRPATPVPPWAPGQQRCPARQAATTRRPIGLRHLDAANDFAADQLAEPAGDKCWSEWYRAAFGLAGCAWRSAGGCTWQPALSRPSIDVRPERDCISRKHVQFAASLCRRQAK
jgi:hypothetical protein